MSEKKDVIKLPASFIEKYVRFSDPEYIKVYLYAKYMSAQNGKFPETGELAARLGLDADKVAFIIDFWIANEELTVSDAGTIAFSAEPKKSKPKPESHSSAKTPDMSLKPSYSGAEIKTAKDKDPKLSELFYQAENILGKLLSASDQEMIYSFYDWLGLPVEVIVMILSYAAKVGKTNKRYIEKLAIDWADKEINTYEKAELYIKELEAIDSAEHSVRSILGIYDRALTQTEKKYIKRWTQELHVPTELIQAAYDKTVEYTGKLAWSYMNKLIVSWMDEGITDLESLKKHEELFKLKNSSNSGNGAKPAVKKSKFNNYTDTNKTDYDEIERHLDDLLDTYIK